MGFDKGNNKWPKELMGEGDRAFALHVKGPVFETQPSHFFYNKSGVLLKNNNKDE